MTNDDVPQKAPQNVPKDERIAHLVRLAGRGFARALQIRLAAHDVNFGHWVFLRILWDEDGLSQRELSARASLTEPTTHTALQRLEALGYLERRKLGANKRRQHVFLTEIGQSLRHQLEPMAFEVNTVALDGIGEADQSLLREMLVTIIGNLQKDEDLGISEGRKMPPTRMNADG
jgi:DNA-binding MarR family transcriptional regulator